MITSITRKTASYVQKRETRDKFLSGSYLLRGPRAKLRFRPYILPLVKGTDGPTVWSATPRNKYDPVLNFVR